MKIYRNGALIEDTNKQPRKHSKYAHKGSSFKKFVAVAAVSMFIGGYGIFISQPSVVSAITPEVIDMTPAKIEALKMDVVNQIKGCESAGHSEESGLIIFDSNNQASIGQLQWQIKSVQFYEKKLHGKDINRKEAIMEALDTDAAAGLAKEVIFEADGLGNWLNCANRLNLRAEVNAINKLSQ